MQPQAYPTNDKLLLSSDHFTLSRHYQIMTPRVAVLMFRAGMFFVPLCPRDRTSSANPLPDAFAARSPLTDPNLRNANGAKAGPIVALPEVEYRCDRVSVADDIKSHASKARLRDEQKSKTLRRRYCRSIVSSGFPFHFPNGAASATVLHCPFPYGRSGPKKDELNHLTPLGPAVLCG